MRKFPKSFFRCFVSTEKEEFWTVKIVSADKKSG